MGTSCRAKNNITKWYKIFVGLIELFRMRCDYDSSEQNNTRLYKNNNEIQNLIINIKKNEKRGVDEVAEGAHAQNHPQQIKVDEPFKNTLSIII